MGGARGASHRLVAWLSGVRDGVPSPPRPAAAVAVILAPPARRPSLTAVHGAAKLGRGDRIVG